MRHTIQLRTPTLRVEREKYAVLKVRSTGRREYHAVLHGLILAKAWPTAREASWQHDRIIAKSTKLGVDLSKLMKAKHDMEQKRIERLKAGAASLKRIIDSIEQMQKDPVDAMSVMGAANV